MSKAPVHPVANQVHDLSRSVADQVETRLTVDVDPQRPGHARIWLHWLRAKVQRRGDGARFMRQLCELADDQNLAIELNARTNPDRNLAHLVRWYASFGFRPEALLHDPDEAAMRRAPAGTA